MDENEKATQINFLRCSHRVTDCTPAFKASFLGGGGVRKERGRSYKQFVDLHA